MIITAYRRKRDRSAKCIAMITCDTETGRCVRRNRYGQDIDHGRDVCRMTEEGFREWATVQYPNDWSLDLADAWWVGNDLKMDVGL